MTPNGSLPHYLLIYSETTELWHLTDRHGALLLKEVTNPDTLIESFKQAGAKFQIVDPTKHIERHTNDGTPQDRNNHT